MGYRDKRGGNWVIERGVACGTIAFALFCFAFVPFRLFFSRDDGQGRYGSRDPSGVGAGRSCIVSTATVDYRDVCIEEIRSMDKVVGKILPSPCVYILISPSSRQAMSALFGNAVLLFNVFACPVLSYPHTWVSQLYKPTCEILFTLL